MRVGNPFTVHPVLWTRQCVWENWFNWWSYIWCTSWYKIQSRRIYCKTVAHSIIVCTGNCQFDAISYCSKFWLSYYFNKDITCLILGSCLHCHVVLFGVCVLKCHVGYCYFNCGLVLCFHWSSVSFIRETCLATQKKACGSWFSGHAGT